MTRIKICGIQSLDIAQSAVDAGADCIGFVFAPSRRAIAPEQARFIAGAIPETIGKVGVFVNDTPETVAAIARTAMLTHIQLHGNEDPAQYRHIGLPIIKAMAVSPEGTLLEVPSEAADFILLDTQAAGQFGGTGKPFRWTDALAKQLNRPLFLAGGLNPENVTEALRVMKPYGVDVSSGVETNGIKSPERIRSFIEEVRQCPY